MRFHEGNGVWRVKSLIARILSSSDNIGHKSETGGPLGTRPVC